MSDVTTTFEVRGMTCGHCEQAVRTELATIDGVRHVDVDLGSGRVTVTSGAELSSSAIAAAVDEAGYELADEGQR